MLAWSLRFAGRSMLSVRPEEASDVRRGIGLEMVSFRQSVMELSRIFRDHPFARRPVVTPWWQIHQRAMKVCEGKGAIPWHVITPSPCTRAASPPAR